MRITYTLINKQVTINRSAAIRPSTGNQSAYEHPKHQFMASINQVVSEIAHAVGQPNNYVLRRNIRSILYHERNERIRRNYENHKYVDSILEQRIRISIIDVPDGDLFNSQSTSSKFIKRSEFKVPRPVRLTNNLPFNRVSSTGYKSINIPFIKESRTQFYTQVPGMKASCGYDYINGYIYLSGEDNNYIYDLNSIILQSPFEIPTEISIETYQNKGQYISDDDEFILPEDMVEGIKELIFKRNLLNIPRETNEIPTNIEPK